MLVQQLPLLGVHIAQSQWPARFTSERFYDRERVEVLDQALFLTCFFFFVLVCLKVYVLKWLKITQKSIENQPDFKLHAFSVHAFYLIFNWGRQKIDRLGTSSLCSISCFILCLHLLGRLSCHFIFQVYSNGFQWQLIMFTKASKCGHFTITGHGKMRIWNTCC